MELQEEFVMVKYPEKSNFDCYAFAKKSLFLVYNNQNFQIYVKTSIGRKDIY